jgi:PAS domain S-box-containing protein
MKDQSLRVLIVEDSKFDTLFIIRELTKSGYNCFYERVETASSMRKAIQEKQWDIILCDYIMPDFNAPSAIALLKEVNIDIPIIVVSGAIGEETAVECMRSGAHDYIMKTNLSRLCPAIARELEEADSRSRRKQAESARIASLKALLESQERYKALFDRSLNLINVMDFDGKFIDANNAALNLFGYKKEEIKSVNVNSLVDEDQLPHVLETIREITETGTQKDLREIRLRHKDGREIYVEAQGSAVMSKGKPVAIQVIAMDITERKKAEAVLQQTLDSLRKSVGATIQVMVSAVEMRDPYTAGHQSRSADLACAIATEMGLVQDKIEGIRMAGIIHDIGKLSIPAEILSKPTKLTEIEFSLIKEHARSGYEMLKDVESPWPLAEIVYQHHERMDGSGYPRNLKGDEILMESRILAVADVVESMASHRPYRPTLGIEAALEEITKNKDILYDAAVVDACLRLFREKGYQLSGYVDINSIKHVYK